jgi:apolipoprotein N-acyltransferase
MTAADSLAGTTAPERSGESRPVATAPTEPGGRARSTPASSAASTVVSTSLAAPVPSTPPPLPAGSPWRRAGSASALRCLAAALAGLLLLLAAPPFDLWPLGPVGVALLAGALHRRSARLGALLGLLAGLAYFVPMLRWAALVAGNDAWLVLALTQAVQWAALGAALALMSRLRAWPAWATGLWVLGEALRDRAPFGGFPWGRLSMGQSESPLAGLAVLGGSPLVTAAVALSGCLLAAAAMAAVRHRTAGAALAGLGALAVPLLGLLAPAALPGTTPGGVVTVAVVQGNVPGATLAELARERVVLRNHVTLTEELAEQVAAGEQPQPDLVVWPENSSDIDPYSSPEAAGAIEGAAADIDAPLLAGVIQRLGTGDRANLGVAVGPGAGLGERYVKRAPVPFAEYMPFRPQISALFSRVDELLPSDVVAGEEPGVLDLGEIRLGTVICFEVAFDDLVRDVVTGGGRLLTVQTNNATFGDLGEAEQQVAMARLRAIEHGRSTVVSSTSGISAVIGPDGATAAATGTYTRELLVEPVELRDGYTLATRLGAVPELLVAALGLGGLVWAVAGRRGQPGRGPGR